MEASEVAMAYSAQLAVIPAASARSAPRRLVNVTAYARRMKTEIAEIKVTDLSTKGCRFRCNRDLDESAEIWLKISGTGARRATIVWSEEGQFGCEFVSPLDSATVEQLAAGAYETLRKRRSQGPLF
jgi:hypothetical protein